MNWIDQAKVTDQDWRGRFSLTAIFCEWISTGLNYLYTLVLVSIEKSQKKNCMDHNINSYS